MYDTLAHVIEYISYWFSMSVVSTLKYILGLSIFVSGGSHERKNGALKVVDVAISSYFKYIESYHSYLRGIFNISPIWSGVGGFVGRLISFSDCIYVSDLIEYESILLDIGSEDVLIYVGSYDMYPITFYSEFMAWNGF